MLTYCTPTKNVLAVSRCIAMAFLAAGLLIIGTPNRLQAQLTLAAGGSATINSTITYPSVSIAGANTTLTLGSSANVTVTGGFTWLDQPSYISIASGASLTIGGDLQGDGNTSTNNNYYPCISSTGITSQAMIIDCKGSLTVNGNLGGGTATKRFKNWVFLHIDSGATVTLNGNDNVLGPRGIIYVHKGGTLKVNGSKLLVEYAYSRIDVESGGTMTAVNLTINGNGSAAATSACSTNPYPYNGIATTSNPPYTSLNVDGTLTVSGNLSIDDASVSTSTPAMTLGTGHFTIGNTGTVSVGGNFINSSTPTTTGSDTATINGTLTVTGNAVNNSDLHIGTTGVMTVSGSTGLSNNTGSVYGVSLITVDGKLNVGANITNNGLINIDATGYTKVFGNLYNNTITTYGVAIITVISDLYVQGNIVSNDIIRAVCPSDTTSYVAWGGTWTSGAHDTVQNYSSGVKYYTGTQIPPGQALNLCTGHLALLTVILPVQLESFTIDQSSDDVNALRWLSPSSQLPQLFIVQRASDPAAFTDRSVIMAVDGQSAYSYSDKVPDPGTWYYRLKMVMPNGSIQYSQTLIVRYNDNTPVANLRPSVTSQPRLTVYVNMPSKGRLGLLVTDVVGRLLVRQTVNAEKGDNLFTLNIASLKAGVYYVQILGSDGWRKTLMAQKN